VDSCIPIFEDQSKSSFSQFTNSNFDNSEILLHGVTSLENFKSNLTLAKEDAISITETVKTWGYYKSSFFA